MSNPQAHLSVDIISEIINQLHNLENSDETDGRILVTNLINKIGKVIKFTSRIISHLLEIIKFCTRNQQREITADQLTEIVTTLVTLSDLLIKLSESSQQQ